jgi:predicted alpha/beta superfamily hydrolase
LQLVNVERWASSSKDAESDLFASRGRLNHHDELRSTHLGNTRPITVYLPPGYDVDSNQRYPVLYLQDGQNLFDPATAFSGVHWRVAETSDRLIAEGRVEPLIIVAVASTADRLNEYAPIVDPSMNAGGKADRYARFLVDELKPFIDEQYRTKPGREDTGIGGSSLGALASLHACMTARDVFSKCAALSPSLWWGDHGMVAHFARQREWLCTVRLWIDMGSDEGCEAGAPPGHAIATVRHFLDLLAQSGARQGRDYSYTEVAGAAHNEHWWAQRFDRVLSFLFGVRPHADPLTSCCRGPGNAPVIPSI